MFRPRVVIAGIVGALLGPVLWIAALASPLLWAWSRGHLAGSGSASILVESRHLLVAALVGFVVGVWWARRRR